MYKENIIKMGFEYNIILSVYYSTLHNKFGYHTPNGFDLVAPNIPEKYLLFMNGRNGNLDYKFLLGIFENNDENMIFIDENTFELLPSVDEFIEKECIKENVDEIRIYYETLKELIEYLGNEIHGSWYLTFSY